MQGSEKQGMDNGTPTGETASQQPLENNAQPQATAPAVNASDAVAEAHKKAEQAQMEANMLRNKLKAIEDANAAAKAKELEEQQKYKELYEQERAERERIVAEREQEAIRKELASEESKLLEAYPESVKDIVKETGISLTDTSDDAKAALKTKLDTIAAKLGTSAKVTPNNNRDVQKPVDRAEILKQYRETGDPRLVNAAVNELSFVKAFEPSR